MAKSISTIEIRKVEKMDLSGMCLDSLPNPTVDLTLIGKLDLSGNNLQSIPESLTAKMCTSKKSYNRALQELNANFNKLTRLPDNMGPELVNLQKLSVNSNKLSFLPISISRITSLRILDARLNCLRSLPGDIDNLINLEVLNVSQNFQYLRALPHSVGGLISLIELDASYNRITTLPHSISCLRKLRKLSVEGNPLVSPPMEVVEHGVQVVKDYLRNRMNGTVSSPTKRGSWLGKLVRHRTFNGREVKEQNGFLVSDYRAINSLASPRYMETSSPRLLLSQRSHCVRWS
ncbi:plant intracellular Ras-group-related LRR protein 6-like [Magnolia sinica]|uniref:plant intracellular Ras-group-related LRR protein 6-like n=1 Tax=Magnolia sinica TaxID=86752 RepID=UPI002657BD5B|nr:plant intracellular Ras-group-related LRR protein 6-like [Magnolia sinica]